MEVPLAARLGHQSCFADYDVVRQSFAHIINGECCDRRAGQRLHFDTGFVMHTTGAVDNRLVTFDPPYDNRNFAVLKAQRMTKRN